MKKDFVCQEDNDHKMFRQACLSRLKFASVFFGILNALCPDVFVLRVIRVPIEVIVIYRPVAQTACFIGFHNEDLLVVIALAGDNGFCYVLSFSGYTTQMLL